ncbi:MAG TPA: DUF2267 domain-containing protein [Solirubrobacteraceae bacterium]|jgi:uncharacterized protein (DUF2267 family)|nr:DUF2267 domain-containing protein [Solirubrobacteraceae bacterium]
MHSASSQSQPAIIERSVEKASIWLDDLASELGDDDRQYAYRVLRAVLHVLRDRLTIDAAAKLAAQLPTLIRGIYYEDWDPSRTPMPAHTVDTFLEHVVSEGRFSGETEASVAVTAVAAVLRKRLTLGEIDVILAVMPEKLRVLVEA